MIRHAVLILSLSVIQMVPRSSAAQEDREGLLWYKGFFEEAGNHSTEELISGATERLRQAREKLEVKDEAKALTELGLIHLTRTRDYDQAMDDFIESLTIEDAAGLIEDQVISYLGMSQVYEEAGNNFRAAQCLDQAMDLNGHSGNVYLLTYIAIQLGKLNAAMGRTQEAFENYELALSHQDQVNEPEVEAEVLFNLAHLHGMQGDYTEALQYHKRSLAIRRAMHDKKNEARSLNDIGELYRFMKNDERALANHLVALEIRQALEDKKGLAESYNNIGALYYHQKKLDRAVANLNLALAVGLESQAQDQISKSYELLSACYKELGDFEQALSNKERYIAILDFIQNEKNERQLIEAQNRYVVDKKESQIDELESDRAQREQELLAERKIRNTLYLLFGLALIVVFLILYAYLVKRRANVLLRTAHEKMQLQNLELKDLNATKDKFFSILSHDLKGPLNSLTSFSGLLINHTDSLSKDEIQTLAKDLDKSIKNLFGLLENLLEWSRSQTGAIDFTPEPFDLAALLEDNKSLLHAQAQNKRITIMGEFKEQLPVVAHRNSVSTVVRNLISNAIKFTPEGGAIKLELEAGPDEAIVSVADTGVGMSPEVMEKLFRIDTKHTTKGTADEKGTGLGLILCKEFIEKNGGRIWVASEIGKGSVFYFTLPRREPPHALPLSEDE